MWVLRWFKRPRHRTKRKPRDQESRGQREHPHRLGDEHGSLEVPASHRAIPPWWKRVWRACARLYTNAKLWDLARFCSFPRLSTRKLRIATRGAFPNADSKTCFLSRKIENCDCHRGSVEQYFAEPLECPSTSVNSKARGSKRGSTWGT